MHRKNSLIKLVLAVVALEPMIVGAADSTPELYRGLFQVVHPLSEDWALLGGVGGAVSTESEVSPGIMNGSSETLVLVPAGAQHWFNKHLSVQSYLFMQDEMDRKLYIRGREFDLPNALEVRPVIGMTLKTDLSPAIEIGALLRYEARFKDVTEDGSFENRFRLRPYIDFTFCEDKKAGTSWHNKYEIEPKYVIGEGNDYSFFNALQARVTIGYSFSRSFSVDLRYIHEWGRSDSGAHWKDSFDSIFLQCTYTFGKKQAPKAIRLDAD